MLEIDDLDTPLWGANEIARALNMSERRAFHLLEKRKLPATKFGKRWVSTRRQLLQSVLAGDEAQGSTL
jgi:hypothetical protein